MRLRDWDVPAVTTRFSGCTRTPRDLPKYAASSTRNAQRPRPSVFPSSPVDARWSARCCARSQPLRGKPARSGRSGRRSNRYLSSVQLRRRDADRGGKAVHTRVGPLPKGDVALGRELAVRASDHTTRDGEVFGQNPSRRSAVPRGSRPELIVSLSWASIWRPIVPPPSRSMERSSSRTWRGRDMRYGSDRRARPDSSKGAWPIRRDIRDPVRSPFGSHICSQTGTSRRRLGRHHRVFPPCAGAGGKEPVALPPLYGLALEIDVKEAFALSGSMSS